jgi:selenide,water dikinase
MAQVLRHLPVFNRAERDPKLLVGAESFDDAGVYEVTESLALVQTVDFFPPVVDDPYTYGRIAAANAISDVYAMGGTPKTALNLVAFPDDKLPMSVLAKILEGGEERAKAAGVCTLGGHTIRDVEIKFGMAVTGFVDPKFMTTNAAAKPGDVLFLTKPLGTGFVTTAHKREKCPPEAYEAAVRSMVELNRSAADAGRELGVRSATDITGYGLAGHAFEMAQGSNVTIKIDLASLPILEGALPLAKKGFLTRASKTNREYVGDNLRVDGVPDPVLIEFFFDAQTSGGLVLAVPAANAASAESVLKRFGTLCASQVGRVVDRQGDTALVLRC